MTRRGGTPRLPFQADCEIALLYAGGCTTKEIGDAIGVSGQRIRQRLKRLGIVGGQFGIPAQLHSLSYNQRRKLGLLREDYRHRREAHRARVRSDMTAILANLALALGRTPTIRELANALTGRDVPRHAAAPTVLGAWNGGDKSLSWKETWSAICKSAGLTPRPVGHRGHVRAGS